MIVGLVTMTVVWAGTRVAFTWYVFIGALTTSVVAWLIATISRKPVAS
jgi:hypothetical protein